MSHFSQGKHTTQAHKGIPEGQFEEEQGLKGFFGKVSHLIKPKPSTRWTDIQGPLRPHMFDLCDVDAVEKQVDLLYNAQVMVSIGEFSKDGKKRQVSYRNADGDIMYFCHFGEGEMLSEYGALSYKKGTYIIVPKCLGHTFIPKTDSRFLIVENKNSHYEEPDRGMVGKNAVYDQQALVKPDLDRMHKILEGLDYEICLLYTSDAADD